MDRSSVRWIKVRSNGEKSDGRRTEIRRMSDGRQTEVGQTSDGSPTYVEHAKLNHRRGNGG